MKTGALLSALAAIGSVSATPTKKDPPSKRSNLPAVTASGNGASPTSLVILIYCKQLLIINSLLGRQ